MNPRAPRRSKDGALPRSVRFRQGKELRQRVPRSAHGVWVPPDDRPDIVDLLKESGKGRVPELLPIRYGRMAVSPFTFLRGAAGVMAFDLSRTPVSGLDVQMAGDAHVNNFGLFATPERDQVFDSNDFDETLPGPWEWDLKRLATSLVLVGQFRRFSGRTARRSVRAAARSYRRSMHRYARSRYLDTWYAHLDLTSISRDVERRGRKLLEAELSASRRRTGFHAFPKVVEGSRDRPRIRDVPPLIVHYDDPSHERRYRRIFEAYRAHLPPERQKLLDRYHLVDVAQKVVGIGSVGTRCSVGLFLGDPDVLDPLFLQIKEADTSAYEPFLGPSAFPNHAERVVNGQRLVQHASDIFLGWGSTEGVDYYVRQLRDMKFCSDMTVLGPKAVFGQAELCGAALARAHARVGDPAAIAGYLGEGEPFDAALEKFALAYARQSATDHATLLRAIARGRLPATAIA